MRDLLEVIAEAKVCQRRRLENAGWSYAYSANSSRPDEILIARDQTTRQKTDTLVHEAVHLYYAKRQMVVTENEVIRQTRIMMRRLYG